MPVNPNEAPEGFVAMDAARTYGCRECVFEPLPDSVCNRFKCTPEERKDGGNVYFVLSTDKPATANYPCDDMGTPV